MNAEKIKNIERLDKNIFFNQIQIAVEVEGIEKIE
jgi:hypothetical protein